MSIAITAVTPSAGALPSGDLVNYEYDSLTGAWYAYIYAVNGAVTRKIVLPFPAATYIGAAEATSAIQYCPWQTQGTGDLIKVSGYGKIYTFAAGTTPYPTAHISIRDAFKDLSVANSGRVRIAKISDGFVDAYPAWGVDCNGLGSFSGAPNFNITMSVGVDLYGSPNVKTFTVNASKTVIVNNSVQVYGSYYRASNELCVLLNKANGTMLNVHFDSNLSKLTGTYFNLVIPAGGEIKQFINGYYVATDGSGNLFLYSINNGGELVTQLTPGTFDPTTPLNFFGLV